MRTELIDDVRAMPQEFRDEPARHKEKDSAPEPSPIAPRRTHQQASKSIIALRDINYRWFPALEPVLSISDFVVNKGAYDDIFPLNGNPLQNIDLVADPDTNFVLIMKDGKIYKNTVK